MAAGKGVKNGRKKDLRFLPADLSPGSSRIYRVLDANLNRAREGLRVLEDTARFVWKSGVLFRSLRKMRHRLEEVTREAYPRLVAARESVRDPGRKMAEGTSRSWKGLVAANFRRSQEALRVLEEYGKMISPKAAPPLKDIRFRLYSSEKNVLRRWVSARNGVRPRAARGFGPRGSPPAGVPFWGD